MLDEHREMCRQVANRIPGWTQLTKSELFRQCIANEDNDDLYNSYFAAIQCAYWNVIGKYHSSCNGLISEQELLEWLEDAITYTLAHRSWENTSKAIYNDPNGPDKIMNRFLKCKRANLYQFTNRKKRKDAFGMRSLEELCENTNDSPVSTYDTGLSNFTTNLDVSNYILAQFNSKDYFVCFMLDCIMHNQVFRISKETKQQEFSKKALVRCLASIDEPYCLRFARRYRLDLQAVQDAAKYITDLTTRKINIKIDNNFLRLKNDPYMKKIFGGIS